MLRLKTHVSQLNTEETLVGALYIPQILLESLSALIPIIADIPKFLQVKSSMTVSATAANSTGRPGVNHEGHTDTVGVSISWRHDQPFYRGGSWCGGLPSAPAPASTQPWEQHGSSPLTHGSSPLFVPEKE